MSYDLSPARNGSKSTISNSKIRKSQQGTTHCLDLNLNGKRPGVASDGNFSSNLIRRSGYG